MNDVKKKVVNFEDIRIHKKYEEEILAKELVDFDEQYKRMREFYISLAKISTDSSLKKRIMQLEEENNAMKKKLNISFPTHIVLYTITCGLVMGASIILLFLRYFSRIYTVDPYYIICALLISTTLFFTAIAAIKDWKCFLNGEK